MNDVAKKKSITQNIENCSEYILAVSMMCIFTFLFLGAEYFFVNVISLSASGDSAVNAQNYALGTSAVGFVVYPLINKINESFRKIARAVLVATALFCLFFIYANQAYGVRLALGLVLFLILGAIGGGVYYMSVCVMNDEKYLARTVGVSYMLGILFQFALNNLASSAIINAVVLSLFLTALVCLLIRAERVCQSNELTKSTTENSNTNADFADNKKSLSMAGVFLILLVVLMSCVFSTLDNAVTLAHADGAFDIGELPRILLALSGLAAGFVFDIKGRKFMPLVMYCVMMLSTICITVINFAGPFLIGLVVFYMTAGFFAVFFTTAFMEYSRRSNHTDLWSGLGRAVNNITAAVISGFSLKLLSSGNYMAVFILAVVLFAAVSVASALYVMQLNKLKTPRNDDNDVPDDGDKFESLAKRFSFTPREAEAFEHLVTTEDSVQEIADKMYISRRTLERYISAIYEKTGAKSRIGLFNIYNAK